MAEESDRITRIRKHFQDRVRLDEQSRTWQDYFDLVRGWPTFTFSVKVGTTRSAAATSDVPVGQRTGKRENHDAG
jgi:hypothetical protein